MSLISEVSYIFTHKKRVKKMIEDLKLNVVGYTNIDIRDV